MTVVNIRGTNGSGKSTIAKRLIDELAGEPILNNGFLPDKRDDLIIGYQCQEDIRIVGRYNIKCGGADTFHTRELGGVKVKGVDDVERLIETWASEGQHVLFEGMIVSSIFGRWQRLSQRLGNFIWAILDTPVEVCRERIQARNGGKPLKEAEHFVGLWNRTKSSADKMKSEGETVLWIDHTRAYDQCLELFRKPSVILPKSPLANPAPAPEPAALLQVF